MDLLTIENRIKNGLDIETAEDIQFVNDNKENYEVVAHTGFFFKGGFAINNLLQ
jgi:hypothetical protein